MRICKVIKPLVSTNRIPGFEHKHLKVVQDGSSHLVAVDAVGCRDGDWVICVGSSAAREAAGSKSYPSDLTIVGIIDHWEPPPKPPVSASSSAQASATSSATSQAAGAPAPSPVQTPGNQTSGSGGGAG
ncbi:MAG: carboxysome peptide A [Synechococcus sp. SB0662_bin_45]|nr:carboxysome peptide A [Cyanobacteria bacterium MAG IRC4_bin_6]MXW13002.1 carboxysome peptide A [Synechococcus sp. SB0668_bin_13]MXX08835.1 carboxysome peptide A [Synechococcus sp. SB0667_bin_8]MYE21079.1 carboxysome peptide A [Synechococcus sp. SB0662_bin_45]MYF19554.1 carboxysome peptide A [Synechococcus sp. SB0677_bin_5]MYG64132.1 carboxysome peptide A [Synechococcus sp. SB0675_bin_7]MYI72258.1 carboxysome peptide A [Synechococcus sp. SB0673_bin_10]MYK85208.1 carboxysome peptide A [Syne